MSTTSGLGVVGRTGADFGVGQTKARRRESDEAGCKGVREEYGRRP